VHALVAMLLLAAVIVLAPPESTMASVPLSSGATKAWVARYTPGSGYPAEVVASPSGTLVFVTGHSIYPLTHKDYTTVAYEASSGIERWVSRYNGPGNRRDEGTALGVSPDGRRVFVSGRSRGSVSSDFATIAYDAATGVELWEARYDGPRSGFDRAADLVVSPDGRRVFVTGSSWGASYDYATIAYDAGTGRRLWVRRDGAADVDLARSIDVNSSGSAVFVTGSGTTFAPGSHYVTVAYEAVSGARLWVRAYVGSDTAGDATSVEASRDGERVYVTGTSFRPPTRGYDFATVAYDAGSGDKLWVSRYDDPAHGHDIAHALAVSHDGARVYVVGQTEARGAFDFATIAYDSATGSRLWVRRYDGTGASLDGANALGLSPDDARVYVTGQSWGTASYDFATVAYDTTTGSRVSTNRYRGAQDDTDVPLSLAVSSDGRMIFVTGSSWGSSRSDYATVAYRTG
jgi:hypothetical protein